MEKTFWRKYRTDGLQVVGLNVWDDGNVSKVKKFVAKHKLTYPILIDEDEKVFRAYTKRRALPTNAVIDREGRVAYLGAGFDEKQIRKAVEKALK